MMMIILLLLLLLLCNVILSYELSCNRIRYSSSRSVRYNSLHAKTKTYVEDISPIVNSDNIINTDNIINSDEIINNNKASIQDYIILCIVPLIWGTYSPLIKYLYSNGNILAPPPLLFNLLSYVVSFSTLSFFASSSIAQSSSSSIEGDKPLFSTISPLEWQAGIQLGLLLFFGATIQIMGIQETLATRAAILVQLTTVIVPFIESVINKKQISSNLWISSFVALVGVAFVSADEFIGSLLSSNMFDYSTIINTVSFNSGDLLVCISALFYSCHVVRVSQISNKVSAINLARVKSLTELIASSIAIFISICYSNNDLTTSTTIENNEFYTYLSTAMSDPIQYGQIFVLFTVLWNGIFATALTTWAQTTGQRSIDSITAQLFYSTQPIWAASLSFLLLGDRITNVSFFGCVLLLAAILYSQLNSSNKNSDT